MFTFFNVANFKSAFFLTVFSIVLCLDPVAASASALNIDCPATTELAATGTAEGFVDATDVRSFRIEAPSAGVLRLELDTYPARTARLTTDLGRCAGTDATRDPFVVRQKGRFLDLAVTEAGTVTLRLQAPSHELAYLVTSSFEAATVFEDWVSVGIGDHWYEGFETRLERSSTPQEPKTGSSTPRPLARRALLESADATSGQRLEIVRAPQGRQRTLARVTWSSSLAEPFHKIEEEENDPDPDGGAFLGDPTSTEITLGQKVEEEENDPDPDGEAFFADPNSTGITLGHRVEEEENDPDPDGEAFFADPDSTGITLGHRVEEEENDPDPDGRAFLSSPTHETARRVVFSPLPGSYDDAEQALRWVVGMVASELGAEELPEGDFRLHGYSWLPSDGLGR